VLQVDNNIIQPINITFMNKAELVVTVQKLLGKDVSKASAEKSVNAVIDASRPVSRKRRTSNSLASELSRSLIVKHVLDQSKDRCTN